MQTHNASIYHCVTCGRIVHAELETTPPLCCGHAMVEMTETIHEGDTSGKERRGESDQAKTQQTLNARLKKLDVEVADLREQGAEREDQTTPN
jgi:hypothetical protein